MPKIVKFACPLFGAIVFWSLVCIFGGLSIKTIKAPGKYGSGYIAQQAEFIDQAIFLGHKIEFSYKKKDDIYSTSRTIKPYQLIYLKEGRNSTLCVAGYCINRNADRTFLLSRMSDIRVLGA